MPILKVFDPPMCCSTGICGINIAPQLTRLVADLNFLKDRGVKVECFNLKDHIQAFIEHPSHLVGTA